MNAGILALLGGLFGVPVVLLAYGHRFRQHTSRGRRAWWGALIGYGCAACIALAAGLFPPQAWTASDDLRGAAGLWSLLVLPLLGAVVARLTHERGR